MKPTFFNPEQWKDVKWLTLTETLEHNELRELGYGNLYPASIRDLCNYMNLNLIHLIGIDKWFIFDGELLYVRNNCIRSLSDLVHWVEENR